jgi:hypothetical protein
MRLYPKVYATSVSTRLSNAPFVCNVPFRMPRVYGSLATVIGREFVGLVCDRIGQKVALIFISLLIVLGAAPGIVTRGATVVPKVYSGSPLPLG